MKKIKFIAFNFFLLTLLACNEEVSKPLDNPTQGEISISVDDSFTPIIEAELYAFHSFYKYAKINARYKPEGEAIKDLLNDSAHLIVMSRELNKKELQYFESIKLHPSTLQIAYDALAVIVHPDNSDAALSMNQMKDIVSGQKTNWNQLNAKSSSGEIEVVFDHKSSGNARLIQETFLGTVTFPKNCFAANSNREVVDYVAANKGAIGFIGFNWISDRDDTLMLGLLKKIKVVALSAAETKEYYIPCQDYIKQGVYPLCRKVYIVNREARAGLGTGFAAFVAGDKGQRIILKSGLVPVTLPPRLIQINTGI
ncbi:MAG: substrate-binding domain-containing protein [Bacteroidetes bacterium]|nr:substrate-binding domain-containing protein [Bacteroidota bacterium]